MKDSVHTQKLFRFQPGERVTVSVSTRGSKTRARMKVGDGLTPRVRRPGTVEFALPRRGHHVGRVQVQTLFDAPPQEMHYERREIEIGLQGSRGTLYRLTVRPGPARGRWDLRVLAIEPGGTKYFCLNSRCKLQREPVAKPGLCKACRAKLEPFTF